MIRYFLSISFCALSVFLSAISNAAFAEGSPVVASYEGRTITLEELDKQIDSQPKVAYYLEQNPGKKAEVRASILNNMINRDLLLREATQSGTVQEPEVQKFLESYVQQYGGKEKLEEILKGFRSDYETFTKQMADDFRIQNYVENTIVKGVSVDPKEVESTYKAAPEKFSVGPQVKARHILIKVAKNASADGVTAAEKKIQSLYEEALKGGDFAKLAKENSQDPGSAAQGGDLGFFGKGTMVPEFEKTAFALKKEEVSKPFRTDYGFHIIKLEDTKAAETPTFDQVKEDIQAGLLQQKKEEVVNKKLKDMRDKAKIQLQLPTAG